MPFAPQVPLRNITNSPYLWVTDMVIEVSDDSSSTNINPNQENQPHLPTIKCPSITPPNFEFHIRRRTTDYMATRSRGPHHVPVMHDHQTRGSDLSTPTCSVLPLYDANASWQ